MSITAVCPSCGKRFQAPEQFAGKKVKCKGCGVAFRIGGESPAAPAAGAPAAKKQKKLNGSQGGDRVEIDDSLAQLESVASFADEDAPAAPSSAQKSRAGSGAGRRCSEEHMCYRPDRSMSGCQIADSTVKRCLAQ